MFQEQDLSGSPSVAIGELETRPAGTKNSYANGSKTRHRLSVLALRAWMVPFVGPLALLAIWAFVHATGLVTAKLLPSPVQTLGAIATDLVQGDLLFDLGQSALRTLKAFVLAIVVGLPLGIVVGSSRRVYKSIEFLIDFFRSTPATALFPLFMIILGLGDLSKIAVAAFSAFMIILFNVAYGVMNARPTRMLAAQLMGASKLRVFRDVTLYESLPQTFVGLRTAVSLALVVIIVAEMFIGSDSGLGKRIIDAQITFDMPVLYGTILLTGALGYALNLFLFAFESRFVHWAGPLTWEMTMFKTLTRRSFALGTLGATFAPAAPLLAQAREKVVIAWLPTMQTMAFYVAQEEKLFEKAGIEVEAVRFEAPNQIIDALVSERADVGAPGTAAGITVLAEEKFPGTFKVFGLQGGSINVGRINDGLIVVNNSTITGFPDLRGKTLGHLPGIQWRTISRHMLRKAGLDPEKDVRLVELAIGLQIPAVISGSADATLSLEPVGSIATALGEVKRAMTNPCEAVIADPFYSGVSVLTTKFLAERPIVARKVVMVLDEATQMAERDFPHLRAILPKYTAIKASQVEVAAQPYLRSFADLNATDLASYQALVDIFVDEGVLKKPMQVSSVMLQKREISL